jgi:hypothetical protein
VPARGILRVEARRRPRGVCDDFNDTMRPLSASWPTSATAKYTAGGCSAPNALRATSNQEIARTFNGPVTGAHFELDIYVTAATGNLVVSLNFGAVYVGVTASTSGGALKLAASNTGGVNDAGAITSFLEWHHVVVDASFPSGSMTLQVDGVLAGAASTGFTPDPLIARFGVITEAGGDVTIDNVIGTVRP